MEAAGVMSECEYDGVRFEQPPMPPLYNSDVGADNSKFEAYEAFLRRRLGTSRRAGEMEQPIWAVFDIVHPGWRMALPALIMGSHLRTPRFETHDEAMQYAMNDADGFPIVEDFAQKMGTVLTRQTYQNNLYLGKNPRHNAEAEAAGMLVEFVMDHALLQRAQKLLGLEPEQSSVVGLEHAAWMYAGLGDVQLRDACMVLHLREIYKARDFVNGLMSHSQLHAMQLAEVSSDVYIADKASTTGKSMLAPNGHHGITTASVIKWLASKPEQIPILMYFHEQNLYGVREHVTRAIYLQDDSLSFQRNNKKITMAKPDAAGDESEGEEADEGPKDMEEESTVVTVKLWKGQDKDLKALQVDKFDCPDPWTTPEEFHFGVFTALLEFAITPQWHRFRFPDENGVVGCHVQRILDLDAKTRSDNIVDLALIDLLVLRALSHFFDYRTAEVNARELGMPNVMPGKSIHYNVAEWRKLHGQREAKAGGRVTDAKGRKSTAPAKEQGAKTKSPLGEEYAKWNVSQCSTPAQKDRALVLHSNARERLTRVQERSREELERRRLAVRLGHNARKRYWTETLRNTLVAGVPVYKNMGAVMTGEWRFPVLISTARQIREGMGYEHHTMDVTEEEKRRLKDANAQFTKLPHHVFTTVSGQTGYYPDPTLVKRHEDAWCERAEDIVPQALILTSQELKGKQSAIHAQDAVVWKATSEAKEAQKKHAALRNPSEQQRQLAEQELAVKLQTMQLEQRKAADMKSELVEASKQLVLVHEEEWRQPGKRHLKRIGHTYTPTHPERSPGNGEVTEETLEKWEKTKPGAHPMCMLNRLMLDGIERPVIQDGKNPTEVEVARRDAYYAQCRVPSVELAAVLERTGLNALLPEHKRRVLYLCVGVVKAFGGFMDTVQQFLEMAMVQYDSGRTQLEREARLDAFLEGYKSVVSSKRVENTDATLQKAEEHRAQTELLATLDANARKKEALRILVAKGLYDDRMSWDTAELNMINELKQEQGITVTPPAPASQAGPSEEPVQAGVGIAAAPASTESMKNFNQQNFRKRPAPARLQKKSVALPKHQKSGAATRNVCVDDSDED